MPNSEDRTLTRFRVYYTSRYINPGGWPADAMAGFQFPTIHIRTHDIYASSQDEALAMLPRTISVERIEALLDSIPAKGEYHE